jgi:DNA-binding HxlR family transcriptional regulator
LNLAALRALAKWPMRLAELRQATALPAQTTLRGHLGNLEELGAVAKRPTAEPPYVVENELTAMGWELLGVADSLEEWLGHSPQGPVSLDSPAAKGIVKAFIDGWASTIMRGLAARPMSLTELDRGIPEHSYPALERRLSSMRMANLIEAVPHSGARTPYAVTEWARRGVVPLAAATRCERAHLRRQAPPLTEIDIEAAFLLAIPLVGLPAGTSGSCQLEVKADRGGRRSRTGVAVTVDRGAVVLCEADLKPEAECHAAGSTLGWFTAIMEDRPSELGFDGDPSLPERLVSGLHAALVS